MLCSLIFVCQQKICSIRTLGGPWNQYKGVTQITKCGNNVEDNVEGLGSRVPSGEYLHVRVAILLQI